MRDKGADESEEKRQKWGGGWKETKIKKKGKESFSESADKAKARNERHRCKWLLQHTIAAQCSTVVSAMAKDKIVQNSTMQDGATHTITAKAIQPGDTCTVCVCVSLFLRVRVQWFSEPSQE